ncbi:formylglycine-generating enzyme family protein, partial [Dyella kyungheensis]
FDMGDFGWAETYNAYKPLCEWPCGVPKDQLWPVVISADSRPVHTVRLTSFYMARFLTTIAEDDRFRIVTGRPLYDTMLTDEDRYWGEKEPARERVPKLYLPNLPAYSKSWQEAKDYCVWLGELSGLPVDLPTEAQYEYAARSRGKHVLYATDNGYIERGR